MLSWRVLFPNKPESGNPKRPFLWVLQLKLIGHIRVFPMRSLLNTKVNFFHYIYQPTTSKYWSLPMSKKEYRMSAFERWSLMLSSNYKITAHSLYKVWEMPKYEERNRSDPWLHYPATIPFKYQVHMLPFYSWFICRSFHSILYNILFNIL